MRHPTRLDSCQYLLSRPLNDTLTHFADHSEGFSHERINRYLAGERIPPPPPLGVGTRQSPHRVDAQRRCDL